MRKRGLFCCLWIFLYKRQSGKEKIFFFLQEKKAKSSIATCSRPTVWHLWVIFCCGIWFFFVFSHFAVSFLSLCVILFLSNFCPFLANSCPSNKMMSCGCLCLVFDRTQVCRENRGVIFFLSSFCGSFLLIIFLLSCFFLYFSTNSFITPFFWINPVLDCV